ncbi:hypothetical protein [Candidatus Rariloculus sp.]|uniref:hypothetical protein n=1 Tax=Candidatus Rariloculus sp. TaxID=3101265 RepID=UPI003D12C6CA
MRLLRTISVMTAFSVALPVGLSHAQGWRQYTSANDNFRIHAPSEFEVEDIAYPSEYGAVVPARIYSYEDGANRYSVTVVDYTDARAIHAARPDRTEADYELYWEVDVRASVTYAAANLRKRGGEVTYDAYHYIDRVEGHQLQITNDDGSRTFAAIYLHDSRLYISEATVAPGSPPPGMFQQSLEFLDDAGNRIRYRNYADAIKVRNAEISPDTNPAISSDVQ